MTIKTHVTPFIFAFHNLTYSLKSRRKIKLRQKDAKVMHTPSSDGKMLLNDISGEAREGEFWSTLLDALANRISVESLKGSVTMNGEILEAEVLKMISAYVMQDDLLFPMLTVEETLMFSAEFRLPRSTSKSKKMARVQAVTDELGLRSAAKTLIGDEGHRGISGGERRRVSIGVDIIHGPILLFLDEPTSGLDSSCAFMVVKALQRIARSGRIIIMSVHQPSSRVVGLLDHLMFLSQGETVYYGSPTNLSIFLSEFGHPIPENEDRTEFMFDLYHELEGVPGGTQSIVEFNKSWQKVQNQPLFDSDYSKGVGGLSLREALSACISRGNHIYRDVNGTAQTSAISEFVNPFWVEIIVLVKRWLTNSKRMPKWFILQIGGVVFVGSVIASLFWQLDKSVVGVQERIGFFAFIVTTIFFGCTDVPAVFLQDRYIFMRETAYNAYPIPQLFILSILLASITFSSVGLDGGYSSFLFYFFTIFASFWAVSQVMLGYIIFMPWIGAFHLFSGFFTQRENSIILDLVPLFDKSCLVTGLDIVTKLDATDLGKWSCLWITVALGVFFRILFYFSLLFGSKNKRK
ncbi:hypothetical protein MKX01_012840 [Papaver californicum]|nr:hypothetical protein MKX01_012840 [Papaver californicum]